MCQASGAAVFGGCMVVLGAQGLHRSMECGVGEGMENSGNGVAHFLTNRSEPIR